jgi:membrane associated rhomboid family serine protease
LMGINVLLYLISLVIFFKFIDGDLEQRDWLAFNLGLIPAENVWWKYFTSMFVHAGFFHLLGNMIYLFLFGSCVEERHRRDCLVRGSRTRLGDSSGRRFRRDLRLHRRLCRVVGEDEN